MDNRIGKLDMRQRILIFTAAAIVISSLFPPWMFTFHRLARSENAGWQSERSAGYSLIFLPPNPTFVANGGTERVTDMGRVFKDEQIHASFDVRLDTSRLMVEWICILVAGGTAWVCTRPNRLAEAASQPPSDLVQPF